MQKQALSLILAVSGCPRSGTSACMNIQRAAHGQDKILGTEFPQIPKLEQNDQESAAAFAMRSYIAAHQKLPDRIKDMNPDGSALYKPDRIKDMNPDGSWRRGNNW